MSSKHVFSVSSILAILFLIGQIVFYKEPAASPATVEESTVETVQTSPEAASKTAKSNYTFYSVTRVVDGDTLKIDIDGAETTLRLIGINTPETVDPRRAVQCFGHEASDEAKKILDGKKVRIEPDETQDTYDKYGRTLAYLYLEDGTFFNKFMIEKGYAYEYTYKTPYKYQAEFKSAENSARTNERGLWASETCAGKDKK